VSGFNVIPPAAEDEERPVLVVFRTASGFRFRSLGLSPFEAYGLGEYIKRTASVEMDAKPEKETKE
jgi:hypothetical protein